MQAYENVTRCSMLLIVREIEIKTTMRYHLTPVQNGYLQYINKQQILARMWGKKVPSCTVGGNADWRSHCGKQYGVPSKKLEMDLPHNPALPLLGIIKRIYAPLCSLWRYLQ